MKNYLALPPAGITSLLGIMSCILIFMSALSSAQEIELPNDPLMGQKVFVKKGCIKCHSIFGGGGKMGRDFGKTLVNLGTAGILARMWNHSPEMSSLLKKNHKMPVFSEREMANFIAFIYFLGYLDEEGAPEKGRKVLKDKKCLACHKIGGEGKAIGPSLDKIRSYANPLSLAQRMWRYGARMSTVMADMGIQRPEFIGSEIIDLFAYLREISEYKTDAFSYLTPGRPTVGERLFEEKNCFKCHRIGNKGKALGPDITRTQLQISVTQIATLLWNHGPRMWEEMEKKGINRPLFVDNELADLVAYLYYLKYTRQSGDFITGQQLFIKKRCVKCHAVRGYGGNIAIDLAKTDGVDNYIKITTSMWNHNEKMRMLMEKMGLPMPRFNEKEMTDLFFFLVSSRIKHEK